MRHVLRPRRRLHLRRRCLGHWPKLYRFPGLLVLSNEILRGWGESLEDL